MANVSAYKIHYKNETKFESQLDLGELNVTAVAVAVALLAVIILIGCIGNVMTILAIKKNRKLQTISNVFIVNLSLCDIIDLCCVLPFNVYTYLVDGWYIDKYLCKFVGFLGYTVTGTTIITITLIAYNRYKLVLDPAVYTLLYTKTNVAGMLLAAWIIPVVCLVPAIFEVWGKFCYVPMLVTCNLTLDHNSQLFKLFLLVVRAVIPCILIVYLYTMIFWTTHASHQRLNSISSNTCPSIDIHSHRKEIHLTKMMVMIFILFIISYFPCTVTGIIDWEIVLSKNFHMYCAMSVYIGSAVNPLIYGLMNTQFKKAYWELLPCSHDVNYDNESKVHRSSISRRNKTNGTYSLVMVSTADTDKISSSNSKFVISKISYNDKTSSTTRMDISCIYNKTNILKVPQVH